MLLLGPVSTGSKLPIAISTDCGNQAHDSNLSQVDKPGDINISSMTSDDGE